MKARPAFDYDTLDFKFELKSLDDAGALEGYAAVFGNLDSQGDIIEPGAFTKSIKETSGQVPILYQHDRYEPIGVSTDLTQDRHGLYVKGQLNMDVQRGRETRSLLNQGAMQGLSIGYRTVKKSFEGSARKLQELALKEFSPVTFPANPLAVATVKADGTLVVWDPDDTLDALRRGLSAALNPPNVYMYWVRDIAADGASALVSSYADDDTEAWVVPFTVDTDGDVQPAPSSDWTAAEQVWVADTDDGPGKSDFAIVQARGYTLALGEAKEGRVLSVANMAALKDAHDRITALLELAQPADATADDDGAAKHAETPAYLATLSDSLKSLKRKETNPS